MHQRRLVLRDSPLDGVAHADLIPRAGHWPLVEEHADHNTRNRCWGITTELWMRHVEDLITRTSALVFLGEDLFAVAEIARRVIVLFNLHPYTREELLTGPSTAPDTRERARAVLRVALALGDTDDPELFAVLKTTAHDESANVRNATAYAMSYLAGEESLRLLAAIAEEDPDAEVRAGAAGLLAAWG